MASKHQAKIAERVRTLQSAGASDVEKGDAAFELGSIAYGGGKHEQDLIVQAGAVPPMAALLASAEISNDSKWKAAYVLGWIAKDNAAAQAAILEAGAVPPLVELLKNGDGFGQHWAARALRYIAADNASAQAAIFEAEAVRPLVELLKNGDDGDKRASRDALTALGLDPEAALKQSDDADVHFTKSANKR